MFPKSFSLLMLIVTIQFSQSFAAPRDGIIQDGDQAIVPTEPIKDGISSDQLNLDNLVPSITAPVVEDGLSMQPMQTPIGAVGDSVQSVGEQVRSTAQSMGEQIENTVENSMQSANDQVQGIASAASEVKPEHFSHMLTREQELSILHQVPEFTEIIQAMEKLPDEIYKELKAFLTKTVPKMPQDNLFTKHFENAEVLIKMFERLIVAAKTGAIHTPDNEDLFNRVHQAAPQMRAEMNQFNGFIDTAQSRLANLGTATNSMNSMTEAPTAGVNVTAGSVTLPVGEKSERFADEFAPPEGSTV